MTPWSKNKEEKDMTNINERSNIKKYGLKVISEDRFETATGKAYITKEHKTYHVWGRGVVFLGYTYSFASACECAMEYERR